MKGTYPEASAKTLINYVGKVWSFRNNIQVKDLAVLPLKTRSAIAIGEVAGGYQYTHEGGAGYHSRQVRWIRTDLPRSPALFGQDLLYSLGLAMTICNIKRNDAEKRIRLIAAGTPVTPPPAGRDRQRGKSYRHIRVCRRSDS